MDGTDCHLETQYTLSKVERPSHDVVVDNMRSVFFSFSLLRAASRVLDDFSSWFTSGLDDEFLAWRQERTSSTTSADTSPEKDRRGREKCAVVMEEDDAAARHHEILAYLQTEYMKPMKPENVPPVAAKKFLADRAMWERAIQKDLQYDRLSVEELMQWYVA